MAQSRRSIPVETYIRKVWSRTHWVYRVQIGGVGRGHRRSRDCATLEESVTTKREWLAQGLPPRRGRATQLPDDVPATFADAINHYIADLFVKKPKAAHRVAQVERGLQRYAPELLTVPVSIVTEVHFALIVERRRSAGVKDGTIIRDLRALRAAVKRARPDFRLPAEVMPAENLTRVRVLPDTIRGAIFPYIAARYGPRFARAAELAMLAVLRLNDVRTMTRSMVHLPERLLLLPTTKGGRPRAARLSWRAVEILRAQTASHQHEIVFCNPATGQPYTRVHLSRVWRKAARAFGLAGFTFHDLRHDVPTRAVNDGANTATLQAIGGWQSAKMVERYASVLAPTVDYFLERAAGPAHAPAPERRS